MRFRSQRSERWRRLAWFGSGLTSQAFSSAANFLLVISVARVESPIEFGGFALAYGVYLLVMGTARGLIGETLSVVQLDEPQRETMQAARAAIGAGFVVGGVSGVGSLLVGLAFLSSAFGPAMIAFAVGMPLLLAQDAGRFVGFALNNPVWAARSDGVWLAFQLVGSGVLYGIGRADAVNLIGLWCLSAGLGILPVVLSAGSPSIPGALPWLLRHRRFGVRFAAEFLVGPGSGHLTLYMVGSVSGLAAAGALRAAQTVFGPLNTLLLGLQAVALPLAVKDKLEGGSNAVRIVVLRMTTGFGAAALGYGLIVLVIPASVGAALFSDTWSSAVPILLPLALRFLSAGVGRASMIGLRAMHEVRTSLQIRTLIGVLTILLGLVGAFVGAAVGTAYGMAVAYTIGAGMAIIAFHRKLRE